MDNYHTSIRKGGRSMDAMYVLAIVAFIWLFVIFFRNLRQGQSRSVHRAASNHKRKSSDSSDSVNYGWFGSGSDDDHQKVHHHHGHHHHHNHHHNDNDSSDCSGGGDSGGDSGGGD